MPARCLFDTSPLLLLLVVLYVIVTQLDYTLYYTPTFRVFALNVCCRYD